MSDRFRFLPVQFGDATRYWTKLVTGYEDAALLFGPEYQDPRPRAGEKYFIIWDDHHVQPGKTCGDGPVGLMFCRWPSATTVSFGFGLWATCTGQGLGVPVRDAIYEFLFSDAAIHKIESEVYEGNTRSLGALHGRHARSTEEGRQRQTIQVDGVYYDRVLFGTLRAEWEADSSGNSRPPVDTVPGS